MIADEDAYEYMAEKNADLYADHTAFDGKHGIMDISEPCSKLARHI